VPASRRGDGVLTLVLASALALTPVQSYNQGNQLYARKDFAAAAEAYEAALRGAHDARAEYNLGNALFKSGRIGEAIVRYRRAYALAPRDADVRGNLAFARAYRLDKLLASSNPLARALDGAFRWLSRREAALAAALLFALAAAALALWIVRRWAAAGLAALVLALPALLCLLGQQVWSAEVRSQPAVVVVPEVSAASGPGEEFKQILLLHDGTEVRVREARGDWRLVQLPGGSGGWVPARAIERIY